MRVLAPAAVLLAALLTTAGCAGSDDSPGTPQAGTSPTGPTASTSMQATQPTPPTESTTAPTASGPPSPAALVDRLLPTGLVPGLTRTWKWQDGDTGEPTTDPFGTCAKTDLLSIGATQVVERTYFPPDDSDDNAAEQVAEFPDAATAARTWAVLRSWHDRCAKSTAADHPGLRVGALTPVPVAAGSGRWYLLSWQPAGEETGRFEALGMVLNGTRIAVLRIDNSGQDHDYPPGQEPMVSMVTAAAGWLT
jgi:hypothetical protein